MNPIERFFGREHGASRAFLFGRAFLLMLALDTWMLMIGHAGRYGVAGFNVAQFAWLDALQPVPSARSYVAVLLLTGLLALVIAFTGITRAGVLVLFALYTFSWSMSMLDSYQHHYFVSLILFCLAFFPQTSALEIHPPLGERASTPARSKQRERAAPGEWPGLVYAGALVAIALAYRAIDARGHTWIAFFLFAAAIALATWFYTPPAGRSPLLAPGWGFSLLGATVAIVYTFTAIAKIDANWLAGHTLRQISSAESVFAPLVAPAARLGIERERLFGLIATAVIPQEFALAGCYLLAVHQDRLQSRLPRVLCSLGFLLAVGLHVGAEALGLEIGWFSYYMLLLACCFLLPLPIVDRLATVFTAPAGFCARQLAVWQAESPANLGSALALAGGSAAVLLMIGKLIDLPGAVGACGLAGAALLLASVVLARGGPARDPRRYAVAGAISATLMWLAIAWSPVRWDFYRFLGGDASRRGEPEKALEAYERGERYAPAGQSRKPQILELRSRLGK